MADAQLSHNFPYIVQVFGIGIFTTAVLTLITPLAAKSGLYVLIAVRVIEGVFEGVTLPCIHDIWSRWAPPHERSRMATIALAGTYVGTGNNENICKDCNVIYRVELFSVS